MLQGIPLAALLFVLFPRLAGPLWGSPADAGARTGLSDRMSPGAITELSLSDAVAFRVSFHGAPPDPRARYWRGPVFSRFDGREWSASFRLQSGRFATREGPVIDYTVTLEPHGKLWLFALEHPASLPRPAVEDATTLSALNDIAFLTHDQQILARTTVNQTVRYAQRSVLQGSVLPLAGDANDNLQLARNNARTASFARELRERTGSDRAFIAAILARFHDEPYVYTLTPPLLEGDPDPVDAFLFDTRRGFCEHYAGAFVVLLRAAGIPSRVVTGYQGGEMSPGGEYMIVRQSDAHAWAEAIVDGKWQRFDPTGAVSPSRVELGLGAALPAGEPVPYLARLEMTWLKSLRLHWDSINYQWQRGVVGFNIERQRDFLREFGLDNAHPAAAGIDHHRHGVRVGARGARSWRACAESAPTPRLRCGRAPAAAWRAPGWRAGPTKDRWTTRSGPRHAGRDGASCCVASARPMRSFATRSPTSAARRCSRSLRAGVDALPRVTHARAADQRAYNSASRDSPMRRRRARNFSSASAWIWRTRSRVTPSRCDSCSSVATSLPPRP